MCGDPCQNVIGTQIDLAGLLRYSTCRSCARPCSFAKSHHAGSIHASALKHDRPSADGRRCAAREPQGAAPPAVFSEWAGAVAADSDEAPPDAAGLTAAESHDLPVIAPGSVLWDDKPTVTTNVEPPVPFGWYPQGALMGGLPPVPPIGNTPTTLHDLMLSNETVRLRGGGILRLYGFARGDLDVATHLFNDIQNPFYVLPNDPAFSTGPNNVPIRPYSANYSLYPRLSRAGLEYYGLPMERLDGALPSARLEIDFLTITPGQSESRPLLRLRLAYGQIQRGEWTIVAGQDWDIVAPLVPSINDNTLQWNNGNLGDRRPQFKVLWDHKLDDGWVWQVQNGIALADAINNVDRDGDGVRDNEYSGLPAYEGRTGFIGPSWVDKKKVLGGAWGLVGDQRTNRPVAGHRDYISWGYGFDLHLPLTERISFRSEIFHGRDLDDFRGGIGQGVNLLTGQEIETTGGWAEVVLQSVDWHQASLGVSMDDPVNADIPHGGRTLNRAWYIGNRFLAGHGVVIGFDFQDWITRWKGFEEGHAILAKSFLQVVF